MPGRTMRLKRHGGEGDVGLDLTRQDGVSARIASGVGVGTTKVHGQFAYR